MILFSSRRTPFPRRLDCGHTLTSRSHVLVSSQPELAIKDLSPSNNRMVLAKPGLAFKPLTAALIGEILVILATQGAILQWTFGRRRLKQHCKKIWQRQARFLAKHYLQTVVQQPVRYDQAPANDANCVIVFNDGQAPQHRGRVGLGKLRWQKGLPQRMW